MKDIAQLSITEAGKKLAAKEISALELTRACLKNIEARNKSLNAYLEVFDNAETQAKFADEHRASGENHPLLGIPLAIKDNILIKGRVASAASKMLAHYRAAYNATVITKLQQAGAVLLGRTNMDEFAMGSSTENSAFGLTRNPLDESRVPGGSSGGSAAAVAAHMALGALGSDTGGSVRQPASFCGLVGLKPTYGAVSRSGLIAMGSSLDQIGPLTRTVADAELLFSAIAGKDPFDSTSIEESALDSKKDGRRIGAPLSWFEKTLDKDVLGRFKESMQKLEKAGYTLDYEIEIPSAALGLAVYYIIMPAEVSTNLARLDGVRYGLSVQGDSLLDDYAKTRKEGFGEETRRRIMLGTYVLSAGYYDAYYGKATAARAQLKAEFRDVLSRVDVIATPTVPSPAFKIGAKSDTLSMYLEDIFSVPANLTGLPAISLPMGTVERGGTELPVGIQFTASHGREDRLFEIGKKLLEEV